MPSPPRLWRTPEVGMRPDASESLERSRWGRAALVAGPAALVAFGLGPDRVCPD
jgi:hypothetical protein